MAGAREAGSLSEGGVVTGQEIMTESGELIGLFLQEPVPDGLSAVDTAERIHRQGGVVYLQHPYDQWRRHLSEEAIERIAGQIDVVEVFNARSDERANHRADDLRAAIGAAAGAGSDAHTLAEIGAVLVEMESFAGSTEFVEKLRAGRIRVRPNRLLLASEAAWRRVRRPGRP